MLMTVPHMQKRNTSWRYRRKVPSALREALGKREIVIPLGSTEAEALRRYAAVHADAERQIAQARHGRKAKPTALPKLTETELEAFLAATREAASLGLDAEWCARTGDEGEEAGREAVAGAILDRYPSDGDGDPVGLTGRDEALLRILYQGRKAQRPRPTVEDAKRLYERERVRGDAKKAMRLERVFGLFAEAVPITKPIESLRREDAKEVRDYMLDGRSSSSVDRYLNDVRAVLNHAIKEFDLDSVRNPFMGLEADLRESVQHERRAKRSFTEDEVVAVRHRVMSMARDDLRQIWTLLEYTGCRLAEVSGLRRMDVHLDDAVPHFDVEWHDARRIKNKSSQRKVPLIGPALDALQEAMEASKSSPYVFPDYCRTGGPDAVSAALGKHVRARVSDRKVTTHSLRDRMKDLLRLGGVEDAVQDIVLGHSSGKVASNYGGERVRLQVAERALRQAFDLPLA